jgi:hypothetical protein
MENIVYVPTNQELSVVYINSLNKIIAIVGVSSSVLTLIFLAILSK